MQGETQLKPGVKENEKLESHDTLSNEQLRSAQITQNQPSHNY